MDCCPQSFRPWKTMFTDRRPYSQHVQFFKGLFIENSSAIDFNAFLEMDDGFFEMVYVHHILWSFDSYGQQTISDTECHAQDSCDGGGTEDSVCRFNVVEGCAVYVPPFYEGTFGYVAEETVEHVTA